jgi:hypothetical protein
MFYVAFNECFAFWMIFWEKDFYWGVDCPPNFVPTLSKNSSKNTRQTKQKMSYDSKVNDEDLGSSIFHLNGTLEILMIDCRFLSKQPSKSNKKEALLLAIL